MTEEEEEEDDAEGGRDEGMPLSCGGEQQVGRGWLSLIALPCFSPHFMSAVCWRYLAGDTDASVCECVSWSIKQAEAH